MFVLKHTRTSEINTLSLHDALPIYRGRHAGRVHGHDVRVALDHDDLVAPRDLPLGEVEPEQQDRKSTRLNSSHVAISYAVFCLKKQNLQTPVHVQTSQTNLPRGLSL